MSNINPEIVEGMYRHLGLKAETAQNEEERVAAEKSAATFSRLLEALPRAGCVSWNYALTSYACPSAVPFSFCRTPGECYNRVLENENEGVWLFTFSTDREGKQGLVFDSEVWKTIEGVKSLALASGIFNTNELDLLDTECFSTKAEVEALSLSEFRGSSRDEFLYNFLVRACTTRIENGEYARYLTEFELCKRLDRPSEYCRFDIFLGEMRSGRGGWSKLVWIPRMYLTYLMLVVCMPVRYTIFARFEEGEREFSVRSETSEV